MTPGEDLRERVLDALAPLPVRSRRLFGGLGFYLEDRFFAVIFDGVLYFRTDDETRPAYVQRGMPPLQPRHRPRGPRTVDRHFEVPPGVLADPTLLREWALRASSVRV
ncbi:MAG: TfoX/Sxy family protein [Dehalococcoidia bacterium]